MSRVMYAVYGASGRGRSIMPVARQQLLSQGTSEDQIGNFATFVPRVACTGNIAIEDHAYIGTGAMIRQGRPGQPLIIGKGAIVGMGAIVTRYVPAGTTVVGCPARSISKG